MINYYQFFDLDGTVIDSDYANFLAYQKSINEVLGIKIEWENKRFTRKDLEKLNLSKKRYNLIISLKQEYFKEYLNYTKLNNSLVELIDSLKSEKRIIVLVSNSEKIRGEILLEFHNIKDKFDYIFFKEDKYIENKYKNALYLLNIEGSNVNQVIDDEESELLNAIDAGIKKENLKKETK